MNEQDRGNSGNGQPPVKAPEIEIDQNQPVKALEGDKDGNGQPVKAPKTKDGIDQVVEANVETINILFTPPATYRIVNTGEGYKVTRPDKESCFVYNPEPQVGFFAKKWNKFTGKSGGKLKTKKHRKTKKRNQKR